MGKLLVSSSPHISNARSVTTIMLEVCIALIPTIGMAVYFYGIYPLFLIALSIGTAVGVEALFNYVTKRPQTIGDCSAIVTGLLVALNIPACVPFYVPIIGSAFAIFFVKMVFGGIGKNFANPAITARIFLLLSWSSLMTTFVPPISWAAGEAFKYFNCILHGAKGISSDVAAVTCATPLASFAQGTSAVRHLDLANMFLGYVGGSMGEVSAHALLVGGVYLIIRRIIDWRVPVTLICTVGIFGWIFGGSYVYILPSILGGGLFLGAFFMATDYATTPNTKRGLVVFAFGCGLITSLIRFYGSYPEGISFAILLMNIVTPFIDKVFLPRPFGAQKKKAVGGAK